MIEQIRNSFAMFCACVGCLQASTEPTKQAEIKEIAQISDSLQYINDDSIVFFNITGTLYESSITFADKEWRDYFTDRVHKVIQDPKVAEQKANRVKNHIVNNIPKRPIEKNTATIISDLQNRHIPVLGITQKKMANAYADNFGEITSKHILSLGIDLQKSLAFLKDSKEVKGENYSFAYGILFTKKKSLEDAFNYILSISNHKPNVVIIDNSKKFLEKSQTVLSNLGIETAVLRYSAGDEHLKDFDPIIGAIQFLAYSNEGKLIDDKEALQIKREHPQKDFLEELDVLIQTSDFTHL